MKAFMPTNLAELIKAMQQLTPQSKILAGGTDLIINLKQDNSVDNLLYVGNVPDLQRIEIFSDCVEIGAAVTMSDIANYLGFPPELNSLKQAAAEMGSYQIRNRATIGGNIAGAMPAADLMAVLFLLDAKAIILMDDGKQRSLPVREIIAKARKNTLATGELIVKFTIDLPAKRFNSAYHKLGYRSKVTVARINAALAWSCGQSGIFEHAKLCLGAIAPAPVFLDIANILVGKKINELLIHKIGELASSTIMEITPEEFDRDYKAKAVFGLIEDLFIKV